MVRVLTASLVLAAACGEIANPEPVAPGAPLTSAQVERAIADLVPADAVAVVRVRSAGDLARCLAFLREFGLTALPRAGLADLAEQTGLAADTIDPDLPIAVAVSLTDGPPPAAPRLAWVVPLRDAADAAATSLNHAVHGRYAGVSEDVAYGRGGGSALVGPVPGAAASVRVDVDALRAARPAEVEMALAILPMAARMAGARFPGADATALGDRLARAARDLVTGTEAAALGVALDGGAFVATLRLRLRAGALPGVAPWGLAELAPLVPAEYPLLFAGPLPAGLVPAEGPWKAVLEAMERGGILTVDPAAPAERFAAVLRPDDPTRFADAWRAAGGGPVSLRGDRVVLGALGAAGAPPEGDPVLWVRADPRAVLQRPGTPARAELRVYREDRELRCELTVSP